MNVLLAFLAATVISFWGSLQLGPVNVCVIQTAMAQGRRQALMVAAGGVIPELVYSGLAVGGAEYIYHQLGFDQYSGPVIILLLLGLGFYNFFRSHKVTAIQPSAGAGFVRGLILAFLNPQLLPFWLGVLVYLRGYIDFESGGIVSPYLGFIAGTAAGAYLLLLFFTWLTLRYKEQLGRIMKNNLNRIVGILFFVMAAAEIIRQYIL